MPTDCISTVPEVTSLSFECYFWIYDKKNANKVFIFRPSEEFLKMLLSNYTQIVPWNKTIAASVNFAHQIDVDLTRTS